MPQDSCSIRGQPQDALNPLDILGPADHGGQGCWIIWPPVQRVTLSDTRRPPVPHYIQSGRVHLHLPLGGGGGGNQGGHGED